ncbi:hypothetical protein Plut_1092 [Pelodictyon luteolum DSM 273]|uniref:Uncharacterized protein n=2 Tax=Pelodictyon luteolum TaxID=1100 RepID=Q3B3X7_CHLL3|nr:hypothetical protein Plut_1092 [Pelodictyon luteolum DSM 273]
MITATPNRRLTPTPILLMLLTLLHQPQTGHADTTATLSVQKSAPLTIMVEELYPDSTGPVSAGSRSVEMSWLDADDSIGSLELTIDAYTSSINERSIKDLWYTDSFSTTNGKKPVFRAEYSINSLPFSEKEQTVEIANTLGTSKISVTFKPPAIDVIKTSSGFSKTYRLQAGTAALSFSTNETTASGSYPVTITTEVTPDNFSIQ